MKQEEYEKENNRLLEESKKHSEKVNSLTQQITKLKQQVTDGQSKLKQLESTLTEQNREIEMGEREKKKTVQDQNQKDVKINRALEEVEKYKVMLKEAKATELGKSDTMKKDLDRVLEDNRKLERQRNELLQAFKKQMKLIDVLKRQKMHIEGAKLLAFTEDEFVRVLELGEKA